MESFLSLIVCPSSSGKCFRCLFIIRRHVNVFGKVSGKVDKFHLKPFSRWLILFKSALRRGNIRFRRTLRNAHAGSAAYHRCQRLFAFIDLELLVAWTYFIWLSQSEDAIAEKFPFVDSYHAFDSNQKSAPPQTANAYSNSAGSVGPHVIQH